MVDEDFVTPGTTAISGTANFKESNNEDEDEEEFTISLADLDDVLSDEDDEDDDIELLNLDVDGDIVNKEEDDEEEISISDLDDDDKEEDDDDDDKEDDDKEDTNEPEDVEKLSAKLKKSLGELEDIRSEMNNTFTSTDTISGTITSLKGMLDALKKDQQGLQN